MRREGKKWKKEWRKRDFVGLKRFQQQKQRRVEVYDDGRLELDQVTDWPSFLLLDTPYFFILSLLTSLSMLHGDSFIHSLIRPAFSPFIHSSKYYTASWVVTYLANNVYLIWRHSETHEEVSQQLFQCYTYIYSFSSLMMLVYEWTILMNIRDMRLNRWSSSIGYTAKLVSRAIKFVYTFDWWNLTYFVWLELLILLVQTTLKSFTRFLRNKKTSFMSNICGLTVSYNLLSIFILYGPF